MLVADEELLESSYHTVVVRRTVDCLRIKLIQYSVL